MRFFNKRDDEELKRKAELYEDILKMKRTSGWKYLENLYKEQLQGYITDNAMNAIDWQDYLKKRGMIQGINLFLTDIEDIEMQGQEAQKELEN